MMLSLLWIAGYLLRFGIFFEHSMMLPKHVRGKPQLQIRYYLSLTFFQKNMSKVQRNFRIIGSCLHLFMRDGENCVTISISWTVLQLILWQLFSTKFDNGHFSMIGIEAGRARLLFLSKAFGKQNIDLIQAFHKRQILLNRILKTFSFNGWMKSQQFLKILLRFSISTRIYLSIS